MAQVPDELYASLKDAESGNNPDIPPSPKGAIGIAQLMPATAKEMGVNPYNPVENERGGKDYLGKLIDQYEGDIPKALAAYNWGQGNVKRKGIENAPEETRNYVTKVLGGWQARSKDDIKPTISKTLEDFTSKFMKTAEAAEKPSFDDLVKEVQGIKKEDKRPSFDSLVKDVQSTIPKTTADKVDMIPGPHGESIPIPKPYEEPKRTLGEKAVGGLEAGLSMASAIPATLAAPVQALVNKARGAKGTAADLYADALESNIYHPHSEAGREYLGNIAEFVDKSGIVALGPVGAEVGQIGKAVSAAAKQGGMIAREEAAGLKTLYKQGSPEGTIFPKIPPKTPVDYTKQGSRTVQQERIAEWQKMGYIFSPNQANPNLLNGILEGISGKIKTAQGGATENQVNTDSIARRSIGLNEEAPLTRDTYKAVREKEGESYQNIKSLTDQWKPTTQWFDAIDNIGDATTRLIKKLKPLDDPSGEVDNLKAVLKNNTWNPEECIELSKFLRRKAEDFFASSDGKSRAIGRAYRSADKALAEMIEANLDRTGKVELLKQWQDSRKVIAITHALEKATNEAGHVDFVKLAGQLKRGVPLTGELKSAAEFAGTFPQFARTPQQIGSVLPINALDGLAAISKGLISSAVGLRPLTRAIILSKPYQKTLGAVKNVKESPTYPKGMDMTPKPVEMPKQSPRSRRIVVEPEETKKSSYVTGTPYRMDETTGRLVSESKGLTGATPDVIYSADRDLKSAQQKLYTGRKFDLTAEERIALDKYDAEVLQADPSKNKVVEGGKILSEQPKTSLTSGIPYTMSGEKLVQETPKGTTLTEPVSDLQNAAKKIQEGRAHELTPEEKISWAKKQIEILRPGAAYKQKKIYPPEEQVKSNNVNKKDARRIKPLEDVRLKNPEVQTELKAMAEESGWAEIGGKGIWDEEKGAYKEERTTWLKNDPRSEWYGAGLGSKEFIIEAVRKSIAGEPMYAPEKYVVKHMINYIHDKVFPLIAESTPEEFDSVGAFEYDNAETEALDRALGNTLEKNEADWADMGGKTTTATKNLNTEQIDELLGGKVKK